MIAIDLKGRKALVTGGDSGLGAATVKSLTQAGADVAISYRYSFEAADQVATTARSMGVQSYTFQLDNISVIRDVDAMFERAV